MARHYTVTIKLIVENNNADEHLRDAEAVCDEIMSWLEGLGARVHVEVREEAVPS